MFKPPISGFKTRLEQALNFSAPKLEGFVRYSKNTGHEQPNFTADTGPAIGRLRMDPFFFQPGRTTIPIDPHPDRHRPDYLRGYYP
jgi:hypothetical protein